MSRVWWLKGNLILSTLTHSELDYLFRLMQPTVYEAEQILFSSDLPGDVLYLIQKGQVEIIEKTSVETEKVVIILPKGYIFGSLTLVDYGKKHCYIKACSQTKMLTLRKTSFERLMKYHPEISSHFVNTLKDYLQKKHKETFNTDFKNGYKRICHFIYDYVDNTDFCLNNQSLSLMYEPQELASLTNTSLEVVENTIERLILQKIVYLKHQTVKVYDRMRLRSQF